MVELYRSVVKYRLDDRLGEKRAQIIEGLLECAHELSELDMGVDDIEREFEDAIQRFRGELEDA